MATADTLPIALRDEIVALLEPLVSAARQPIGVALLLESLGRTEAIGGRADLRAEIERVAGLVQELAALDTDSLDSWAGVSRVLTLTSDLFAAVRGLEQLVQDPGLAEQTRDLGHDLVEQLLAMYLRAHHATLFRVASLLTLITPAETSPPQSMVSDGAKVVRLGRRADRLDLERIDTLLAEPSQTLVDFYFPNGLDRAEDAYTSAERLFPPLRSLAHALGLKCFDDRLALEPPPAPPSEPNESDHFGDDEEGAGALEVESPPREAADLAPYYTGGFPRLVVVVPGLVTDGAAAPARFAVAARMSSAAHPGGARGVIVELLGQLALDESRGGWHLTVQSDGNLPAIVIGPDGVAPAPGAALGAEAAARIQLAREAADGAPAFRVGASTGTRLEVGALQVGAELRAKAGECALETSADARSGAVVIAGEDGFLASLLPENGLRVQFDLGLVWSSASGLSLRGSAGMEAVVPVGRSVGPLTLATVTVALRADASGVNASIAGDMSANVGPVRALIAGLGIEAAITFPADGGNLGMAALGIGPRLPSGIGLTVDAAGVVSGGGMVFHDPVNALYAGVLQLSVHESINVSAFGLIATRLPDGSKGYSLIVFITADGFQPIQLGLGFTLLGIGGMVAVNRTFDESVLRAGLENDTLGTLLFPRDPVGNAPALIRALTAAFPARSGSYLVGVLVRIGWFTPTLITADLALIVELGARKRLLLLGRVRALLPSESEPLLRIQLDALGVFDFDAGTAALDAVLVDSRLLERFVITGSAALRARWTRPRSFALSVGGMNPGFTLPSDFPHLQRLTLSLTTGDNPRLTCDAYFALTSNTVQFGAHAHLYAAALGFSVTGDAGFDVLVTLAPFHFLAEIFASMQLRRGSSNLFKVKVTGSLEGPAPLTLRAKASFEIFWWDVSIRVNATLAEGSAPALPAAVDVFAQLRAALGDVRNWHAELPAAQTRVVSLRDGSAADNALRMHPLGIPRVRQGVVPLNLTRDIERFGEAPVAGATRFDVSAALIDGESVARATIGDDFAPAQFFEMSDEEKLAAPQYEPMDAGVAFGALGSTFDLGAATASPLDYETKIVDAEAAPDEEPPPYRLSDALLALHARHGAAGRSVLRTIAPVPATPFAALHAPGFAVVDAALQRTASPAPAAAQLSFAEASAFASRRTELRAVPAFEAIP
jgi:hypothetical protein